MFDLLAGLEGIVSVWGPIGVFLTMMFPLTPSEIIMPLGGFLTFSAGQGLLGLFIITMAGTIGSTVGALIIYFVALKGGRSVILRYGKLFLIDDKKLKIAEGWFERHGNHAVFLCRMAPVMREVITIPAGLARMNLAKFTMYTFFGSLVWSAFLASVGYFFGDVLQNQAVEGYYNLAGALIVSGIVAYFVIRHIRKSKKR